MTYSCVLCLQHMLQKGAGGYYALKGWRKKRTKTKRTCSPNTKEYREHKSGYGVTQAPVQSGGEKGLPLCLAATSMPSIVISLPRVRETVKPERLYPGHPGFLYHLPSGPAPFPLPSLRP